MHYSGMAFELIAILVIAVVVGKKLDAWLSLPKPYATLFLLILFLVGYFLRIYYSLKNESR